VRVNVATATIALPVARLFCAVWAILIKALLLGYRKMTYPTHIWGSGSLLFFNLPIEFVGLIE